MKHTSMKNSIHADRKKGHRYTSREMHFGYALLLMSCLAGSLKVAAQCTAPTISSLSSSSGYPGSSVIITGTGFNATAANDIIYFGGTKATVTAASTTSLNVTVPTGGTYAPVSVLNSACNLTGYTQYPFLQTYNNSSYAANTTNFDPSVTFSLPVAHWAQNVAIGDLDGDGKPEIVVQQTSLTLSIYRNTSTVGSLTSGSFAPFFNLSGLAVGMNNVVLADMDGDGKLDVVVSYGYPYKVFSVFRNIYSGGTMSGGSFVRTDFGPSSTLDVSGIAVADIDGDGKPDVIVTNNGSAKGVYVYRNTSSPGSTSFSSGVGFATGTGFTTLCTADIDGDGKQDIICANASDSICLFRNTATTATIDSTSLATRVSFPSAASAIARLAAADLDGDGKPDIIMTSQNMNLFDVYPNTATTGTIDSTSIGTIFSVTTLSTPSNLSLGDINGDGKPDIVIAYAADSDISVYLNASTPSSLTAGSFTTQVDFNSGTSGPIATAVADLDGDNLPDIVSGSSINSLFSVFHNKPLHTISGTTNICRGSSTTLSNATAGGTWASSNPAVGSVGSTGVVTGISTGSTTISYIGIAGSSYAGNIATVNVTVDTSVTTVASIMGNTTLSTAISTTLSDARSGGVWSSANTAVATAGSSGTVSGVSAGTAVISYTISTACNSMTVTTNVTVKTPTNGLEFDGVNDYIDIDTVLTGGHSYTKEAWVYLNSYGPHNIFSSYDYPFWVNGTTLMMSNSYAHSGYAYIYDNDSFPLNQWVHVAATYDSATHTARLFKNGVVVASSTSFPTYTSDRLLIGSWAGGYTWDGTMDEVRLWDTALSPTTIQAQMNCDVPQQSHLVAYYRFDQGTAGGSNTGLTCVYDYSGNTNTGTMKNFALTGSTSNYVTGAVGSCNTAIPASPGTFSGNTPFCPGANITLTNAITGGKWSTASSNITVNSTSGLVTGVTSGTATVNYTINCNTASITVTVLSTPAVAAISGNTTLSTTITTTLTDATAGGAWSSGSTAIATIGTSGVVTGVAAGTATITYTYTSGCTTMVTTNVTVKTPANGLDFDGVDDYVDVGSILTSGRSYTKEAWVYCNGTYSNNILSSIDNPFWVAGGFLHLANSYAHSGTTTLVDPTLFPTGQWVHVAATYDSATHTAQLLRNGVVVASSSSFATYVTANMQIGAWLSSNIWDGMIDEVRIWDTALSAATIQGNMNCNVPQQSHLMAYYRLDQGTAGGTNSGLTCVYDYSSNGNGGSLHNFALTGSTSNYVTGAVGSCNSATPVTPGAITGNTPVCVGFSITLSDPKPGGTWSSASSNVTVNSTSGVVTGVTAGTATVNYTLNCSTTSVTVTVNANPTVGAIVGNMTLSTSIPTTLASGTSGGAWTSANTAIATIGSATGVVSGVSAGTANISYTVTILGCSTTVTANVTVKAAINCLNFDGTDDYVHVPTGMPDTLSDLTYEAWVQPNSLTGFHSILNSDGFASGAAHFQFSGSALEFSVSGASPTDQISSYSFTTGQWYHVAAVYSSSGKNVKFYINGNLVDSLLYTTAPIIPGGAPYSIGGWYNGSISRSFSGNIDEVRVWNIGRTRTQLHANMNCSVPQNTNLVAYFRFDQGVAGGTNTGLTCVYDYSGNDHSGTITNAALAGSTSNYIAGGVGSCAVISLPAPGAISGNTPVCAGSSFTLSDEASRGYWSTSSVAASVGSTTGLVTGITGGTAIVNYTLNCNTASVTVTVNAVPVVGPITGTTTVSITASSTLSDTTAGGVCYSANPAVAVIGTTGTVTGLAAGSTVISYSVGSCAAVTTTVNVPANSGPSFTGGSEQSLAVCLDAVARPINSLLQVADGDIGQTETYSIVAGAGPLHGFITAGGTAISTGTTISPAGWSYTPTGGFVGTDAFTVRVSDGAGGTSTTTVNVTISAAMPAIISMTGGGGYCAGGIGTNIGLAGSAVGIDYQLYYSGVPVGAPVAGIGMALSFGPQTAAGTYTATATNPATGCTSAMVGSVTVIVEPLPTAYTLTGGGSICSGGAGVPVDLSHSDIGFSYQLYRAGLPLVGTTITGIGAALSFGPQTVAGVYTVVAKNLVTGCADTMSGSDTVTVGTLPTAYAVMGGGTMCISDTGGVAVGLANSQAGISYQLFRGTSAVGTAIAGTGSTLSFGLQTIAGTYTVTATNTSTGCTAGMSGSAVVTIATTPLTYSVTGGGAYCAGGAGISIGLSGSQAGVSYQLYNGRTPSGSAVTGSGGALSFGAHTTAGTYTVIGTSACAATMTGSATITINALPTIYNVTGGGSICTGTSGVAVGLSGSDAGIYYQLYRDTLAIGSAVAGTGTAISFGPQSVSGTYTVVATNRTTGCIATMTGSALISVGTLPAIVSVTGGGGFCSGGTGVHVGLTGSAAGVNYQLYVAGVPTGASVAGTGTTLDFGPQTTGGVYTATATNGAGCTSTMSGSATITVLAAPTVYSVTGGGGYCSGGTGTHVRLAGSTAGVTYKLYAGTAPVATLTGTGTGLDFGLFTASGSYTAIAINGYGCSSNMAGTATVTVNPNPTVTGTIYTVSPGSSITLTGSIPGGTWTSAYTAYATIGSTSGVVTGVSVGSTIASYTLPTGCYGVHSIAVTSTGRRESSQSSPGSKPIEVSVYPNPNRGTFTIKGVITDHTGEEDAFITISDVSGRIVYKNTAVAHDGAIEDQVQLNGNLIPGIYLLTIRCADAEKVLRIVIEQ